MGRTNPTFRDHLRRFEEEWQRYRRGLRTPHQDHFDELLEKARRFAAASGYLNPAHAYQVILPSMVLAQEVELVELANRVDQPRSNQTVRKYLKQLERDEPISAEGSTRDRRYRCLE